MWTHFTDGPTFLKGPDESIDRGLVPPELVRQVAEPYGTPELGERVQEIDGADDRIDAIAFVRDACLGRSDDALPRFGWRTMDSL
jgi:hypothetical protein